MISTLVVTTPSPTRDLTVLATVKDELGIASSDTTQDATLSRLISQASDAIGGHCRRPEGFGLETVTETFRREHCERWPELLILARDIRPTVSSVTVDGTALDAGDYLLDGSLLRRLSNDLPTRWIGNKIVVAYSAGYTLLTDLPNDIERCCIDLVVGMKAAMGRDPLRRTESIDGVGADSWFDPDKVALKLDQGLPTEITAMLAPYVRWTVR